MKKLFAITFLALLVISMIGMVSAKTVIAGKIYNADYSETIAEADVTITCNSNVQTTTSKSDGAYSVTYNETGTGGCNSGESLIVYAEKGDLSGSKSGTIHDDLVMDVDIGVVNVPLVPEFGFYIGVLTIMSAVGVFFLVRRE